MFNNGSPVIVPSGNAKGLANYPHARLAPAAKSQFLYISGTGSRREDSTFDGVHTNSDGSVSLNVDEQTASILRNIEAVIKQVTDRTGGLQNVLDATVFLIDMKSHYAGMNVHPKRLLRGQQLA